MFDSLDLYTNKEYKRTGGLMPEVFEVRLSRRAQDDLHSVPKSLLVKLRAWIDAVGRLGLREVRKVSGYHDEPLKGRREGQRSIRLNRSYRAIYELKSDGAAEFVSIEEVNKHDY
jgi:toxin HigB-1